MRLEMVSTGHVVFGCMHATRGAAAPGLVALPCAGRLDLASLLLVFARGGAGALVVACPTSECRHRGGGEPGCEHVAARLVERARRVLGRAGLAPSRVALRHARPGEDVAALAAEHAGAVLALEGWGREGPDGEELDDPALSPVERALRLLSAIEARSRFAGEVRPGADGTLLWPGCAELRSELHGAGGSAAALELARLAGLDPAVAGPRCCGEPLLAAGEAGLEAFRALARSNGELVARSGARRVLTACERCAAVMTEGYGRVGVELGVEVASLASAAAPRLDLSAAPRTVAVASGEGTPDPGLGPLAAGATIPWGGASLEGPELRRAAVSLVAEAASRGASAAVLASSHEAARARGLLARGAWQPGPAVAVLDAPSALLRFASRPPAGEEGEGSHGR